MIPDVSPATSPIACCLRDRRTVQSFLPTPPPPELIWQAIELARWAPNHKLTEPWRFHVLGPETARAIVELNAMQTSASKGPDAAELKRRKWSQIPGWLVVTLRKHSDPFRHEENYAAVCCAIQNLMLFLWSEGVGTKWATGEVTRSAEFAQLLGIHSDQEQVVGLIWYGSAAQVPAATRTPVSEISQVHP